jgi:hypothetical protein
MTPADAAWHDSFKPNWTGNGGLLVAQDDDQGRTIEVVKLASSKQVSYFITLLSTREYDICL